MLALLLSKPVFDNPLALIFEDEAHSVDEQRELIIGHAGQNRLLLVCFTERFHAVRIISAPLANRREYQLITTMSYSDFTLKKVRQDLGINICEVIGLFSEVPPVSPDDLLRQELSEGLPLVLARGSEKARSEWIISPVLTAVRRLLNRQISLFSGEDFTVEPNLGLNGICDFIISKSPIQLEIEAPVVVIIEAKKENLNGGLGQCIAEMVAAQKFNISNNINLTTIFGSVTSGTAWKFLKLSGNSVEIDLTEYPLPPVEPILGFLTWMLSETSAIAHP